MASAPVSLLDRQVKRVRRRLIAQSCLNHLVVALIAACALTAVWVLAKPFAFSKPLPPWADYAVVGGLAVVAIVTAVGLALRTAPSPVTAALSLDERFKLRERVTTSLTMSEAEQRSPAGQALLADATAKVESLHVGERFPVRFGWRSALVPAAAVALAALWLFYDPAVPRKDVQASEKAELRPEVIKEIEQKKLEYLQKPKQADPTKPEKVKSEDIKRIEAQIEEILKKPTKTQDDVKDRLAELSSLEEQMKKAEREQAEKVDGFKEQMQKLDQLIKKDKADGKDRDGLAKDLKDQLAKGNTEKAKEEAERLGKKIKDGDLINKKDKEDLANELKDLKDNLERLSREKEKEAEEKRQEKEKQLKEQHKEGKIDKEQLDREMNKLNEERKKTSDTQELADKLSRAEQALKEAAEAQEKGDQQAAEKAQGRAAQELQDAAEQLQKMEDREKALDELDGELQRLQDLTGAMGKACDKCRDGSPDDAETLNREGDGEGKDGKDGKGQGQGSGKGKGGKGVGRRPENRSGTSGSVAERQRSQFDQKGKKIHVGTAEGKSIIGKTGPSITGEIQQASQDAPEAIEVQRIPRGYKDSAKGYFKNIGGQQAGPNVPKK